jgi:hypothetical protein
MFSLKSRPQLWPLRLRGAAGVKAECEQREQDANQAKTQTNQDAWIKETGPGMVLFFHKDFFLCQCFGSETKFAMG